MNQSVWAILLAFLDFAACIDKLAACA